MAENKQESNQRLNIPLGGTLVILAYGYKGDNGTIDVFSVTG